jgi:hypothetical protein
VDTVAKHAAGHAISEAVNGVWLADHGLPC